MHSHAAKVSRDVRLYNLDMMRGVAAAFVVVRHTESFWKLSVFRSYLAVDIFFIMSGFVIARAYEQKLLKRSMNSGDFIRARILRLWPVYILGVAVAAIPFLGLNAGHYGHAALMGTLALTAVMIPSHFTDDALLFVMAGPFWSLFYEMVVNVLYATVLSALKQSVLPLVCACLGLLLAAAAFFRPDLSGGFYWSGTSMLLGLTRAAFGIFTGVFVFRTFGVIDRFVPSSLRPWMAVVAVCGIMLIPDLGRVNAIVDCLAIVVAFPLLLTVMVRPGNPPSVTLASILGAASYPMYVLHVPLYQTFEYLDPTGDAASRSVALAVGVIFLVGLVALSAVLEAGVDQPLRRRLTAWSRRRPGASAHA